MPLMQMSRFMMIPWTCLAAVIFFTNAITGCNAVHRVPAVNPQPVGTTAELEAWEEGIQAFREGNYQKASAIFEFLNDSSGNEKLCQKAVYALACARMATAQTVGEFNEALALWNCSSQNASEKSDCQDPRMLTPLLERLNESGMEQSLPKAAKPKRKSSYTEHTAIRDLAMYKNLLQAKEKELEKVKAKLNSREKEVRRLKHQIDSLEAIHLKYQERKKEISTP